MSNGYGSLGREDDLNLIRYEGREYWLGMSWTSSENYIEIGGLDPDRPAGPWGGREIHCDLDRVILPEEVAVKAAAAILRQHVDDVTDPPFNRQWRDACYEGSPPVDAFIDLLDNTEDRDVFVRLLDAILGRKKADA